MKVKMWDKTDSGIYRKELPCAFKIFKTRDGWELHVLGHVFLRDTMQECIDKAEEISEGKK